MIGYTQLFLILSVATFVSTEKIFLTGNFGTEIFDTVKNVSQYIKSLPVLINPATVSSNGLIYVTGGTYKYGHYQTKSFCLPTVYKFNATDGSTSLGPSLILGRTNHGITKTSKEIFVCGGDFSVLKVTNTCEKFDGTSWTSAGTLSQNLTGVKMVTLNDIPYCFGGDTALSGSVQSVYAYQKATNSWKQVNMLPKELKGHAVVALDSSKALICGGLAGGIEVGTTECHIFDADTNTFIYSPYKLEFPFKNFGLVNVKGTIYRLGGQYSEAPDYKYHVTDTISTLTPPSKKWIDLSARLIYVQDTLDAVFVE